MVMASCRLDTTETVSFFVEEEDGTPVGGVILVWGHVRVHDVVFTDAPGSGQEVVGLFEFRQVEMFRLVDEHAAGDVHRLSGLITEGGLVHVLASRAGEKEKREERV